MPEGKILEKLAEIEGCFISSLKNSSEKKRVIRILTKIEPVQYSLEEWEYSISYLMGRPVSFPTYSDVSRFLEAHKKRVGEKRE